MLKFLLLLTRKLGLLAQLFQQGLRVGMRAAFAHQSDLSLFDFTLQILVELHKLFGLLHRVAKFSD